MIRIFKTDLIREQMSSKHLTQLATDFKRYKETGIPANHFGRDAPYNHANSVKKKISYNYFFTKWSFCKELS